MHRMQPVGTAHSVVATLFLISFCWSPASNRALACDDSPTLLIEDPTPTSEDHFGLSIDIDGAFMAVGAPSHQIDNESVGQAHVLHLPSGALARTFNDPTPTGNDSFGRSVAIHDDLVLIGASQHGSGGFRSGQAHLYCRSTGALLLTLENPDPKFSYGFGSSVALNERSMFIAAPHGPDSGRVYVFDIHKGVLMTTIDDPTPTTHDRFGEAIAITGALIVVSDAFDDLDGRDTGRVHLFSAQTGELVQTLRSPSPEPDSLFGYSLGIYADRLVVGAPSEDTHGENVGRAYLFDANTGQLVHVLSDPAPTVEDVFGFSVAVTGDEVLVGVPRR